MGDLNQWNFVRANATPTSGPVLEIGSKDYGNTPDYRSIFPDCDYLGVDIEVGPGVDLRLDLTDDYAIVSKQLGCREFKTIICCSVLEHCENPFRMADNICRLLAPGGQLFVSAPFVWRVHGYPSDYWRFTPNGIKSLFRDLEFANDNYSLSTNAAGTTSAIDNFMFRIYFSNSQGPDRNFFGRPAYLLVRLLKKLRILSLFLNYPNVFYVFPPVQINMIGKKK